MPYGTDVTLSNTTVSGNTAYGSGGGIGGQYTTVNLNSVEVSDNFGRGGGGGVAFTAASVSGNNVQVLNNTAGTTSTTAKGGGVSFFYRTTVSLSELTVQGNSTTGEGGGIAARNKVSMVLSNSSIDQNQGVDSGGGIFIDTQNDAYSGIGLYTVNIGANSVTGSGTIQGGGLYVKSAVLTAQNLTVSGNSASNATSGFGAGIHAQDGAEITITSGAVSSNVLAFSSSGSASGGGGGVSLEGASLVASGLNVDANSTDGFAPRGGGVLAHASSLTLSQSTVSNNLQTGTAVIGSGIYIGDSAALIASVLSLSETTVSSNSGTGGLGASGAGVAVGPKADGLIDQSTVANNTANATISQGGGLLVFCGSVFLTPYACSVTLSNTTISGNSATNGGGISLYDYGSLFARNTTVYANNATTAGSQLLTQGTPIVDLANTLVGTGANAACYSSGTEFSLTVNNSNWFVDDSCDGVASGDPRVGTLTDNGGLTLTHLPAGNSGLSGGGDAATCSVAPVNGIDQRGEERPDPCSIGAVVAPSSGVFFVIPLPDGGVVTFSL